MKKFMKILFPLVLFLMTISCSTLVFNSSNTLKLASAIEIEVSEIKVIDRNTLLVKVIIENGTNSAVFYDPMRLKLTLINDLQAERHTVYNTAGRAEGDSIVIIKPRTGVQAISHSFLVYGYYEDPNDLELLCNAGNILLYGEYMHCEPGPAMKRKFKHSQNIPGLVIIKPRLIKIRK